MASFAWRKPSIGTSIVVRMDELHVGELVMVYDRQPTGGGWWKPGQVVSLEAEACIVYYRSTRQRTARALFKLERIRRVASPALQARLGELLEKVD